MDKEDENCISLIDPSTPIILKIIVMPYFIAGFVIFISLLPVVLLYKLLLGVDLFSPNVELRHCENEQKKD